MPDLPDLDLRLVRYFTAVAELEHFGRAAEVLRVAQPSLSRQVRRLEQQLGVQLLERTPQGSPPTAAGRAFLAQAHELLRRAGAAVLEARSTAAAPALVVGAAGELLVTAAVRAVRHAHPDADVTTRHVSWRSADDSLLDRTVDVLVTRLPVAVQGVAVERLYDEPRVLVVPLDHRLASKESVEVADFADEVLVGVTDPRLDAYWRVLPRPDGRTPPPGPVVSDAADKFELVASGEALTLAPGGRVVATSRPDLTSIPVRDLSPVPVVVAWRSGEDSALLRAFRAAAREHLVPLAV